MNTLTLLCLWFDGELLTFLIMSLVVLWGLVLMGRRYA